MANLYQISACSEAPRGHVIFVHGLGGHPFTTFQHSPKDPETLWPRWIAEDVPGVNVWSIGYQAPPTNFTGTALNLNERAVSFVSCLQNSLPRDEHPIVFVCHSLGGVIVKQMLRYLDDKAPSDKSIEALLSRITGVVFLATPHLGSKVASLAERFRLITNRSQIVLQLTEYNPALDELNAWFRDWENRPQVRVFYETYSLSFMRKVVPKSVGDPGLKNVTAEAIEGDHFQIVKPLHRDAEVHRETVEFLSREGVIEAAGQRRFSPPQVNDALVVVPVQVVPLLPRIVGAIPAIIAITALLITVWFGGSSAYERLTCGPDLGASAFAGALEGGNFDLVKSSICRSKYVDAPLAGSGNPPLLVATASGATALFDVLLNAGADPNARGSVRAILTHSCPDGGTTPLMAAAELNNRDMTLKLLEAGAKQDAIDHCGMTAIEIAARLGATDALGVLADRLQESRAGIGWVQPAYADGIGADRLGPAIISALRSDQTESVNVLLIKSDFGGWRDAAGDTVIHLAVKYGAEGSIRGILKRLPSLLNSGDSDGNTPLSLALRLDRLAIAEILIDAGASLELANNNGETPWSIANGSDSLAQAAVRMRIREGTTSDDLVKNILLGEDLAGLQADFRLGLPPLDSVGLKVERANFIEAKYKIDYQVQRILSNRLNPGQGVGITPLEAAIIRLSPEIVRWLLQNGSDPDSEIHQSFSLARLAVVAATLGQSESQEAGDKAAEIIVALYGTRPAAGQIVGPDYRNDPYYILPTATWSGPLTSALLAIGASGSKGDPTPLAAAASISGNKDVVSMLISHGADPNGNDPFSNSDALLSAIASRDMAIFNMLVEEGAQVSESGELKVEWEGGTVEFSGRPIELATCVGMASMVTELLSRGVEPEQQWQMSPIITAAVLDDRDIAKILVENTHISNSYSEYPLAVSAACSAPMLDLLCQYQGLDRTKELCANKPKLPQSCPPDRFNGAQGTPSCISLR